MTTQRSARTKGSQFELECKDSLLPVFRDIQRYGGEGFVSQVDLVSKEYFVAIECKRWKDLGVHRWTKLCELYSNLVLKGSSMDYNPKNFYLLFKPNNSPCLVLFMDDDLEFCVKEFSTFFGVPFLKRGKKNVAVTKRE